MYDIFTNGLQIFTILVVSIYFFISKQQVKNFKLPEIIIPKYEIPANFFDPVEKMLKPFEDELLGGDDEETADEAADFGNKISSIMTSAISSYFAPFNLPEKMEMIEGLMNQAKMIPAEIGKQEKKTQRQYVDAAIAVDPVFSAALLGGLITKTQARNWIFNPLIKPMVDAKLLPKVMQIMEKIGIGMDQAAGPIDVNKISENALAFLKK